MRRVLRRLALLFASLSFFCTLSSAQQNIATQITGPVNDAQRVALKGNIHPLAQLEFDRGVAPPDLRMERMLLVLQRSPEREAALQRLLDEQQERSSPNYHKWLTPEEYGAQFGASDLDIQTVTAWLQSHGFEVNSVSQGRTVVDFSGTAGQIQSAFQTSIHRYVVNGEEHWANSADPRIPAALAPVIAGIDSLHNFRRKGMNVRANRIGRSGPPMSGVTPQITVPFCDPNCYDVGPYDFATIYNVLPLWQAGIDGTGQTIAIVGRTNINIQDARDFRTLFGLPAKDPQIILNGPDPGINGDEGEADIDVQWSGAVARNATIKFVTSLSTEATDGVDLSAIYIVDRNLAPVMSESYGICELGAGTAGNQFFSQLWQQAAAQGITVFVSTGDNSAAGCDFGSGAAQFGLAVNAIASTPYNVAVGGTDFDDLANPTLYWNPTNDPTTQASVKKYVPESTWNDSCTNGLFASVGFSTNAETNCNDPTLVQSGFVNTIGGSGGASNCTTNSQQLGTCSGGYPKPSWQTGTGVPADSKRDIPDVSLFASNGFVRHAYAVCQASLGGPTCTLDSYIPYGGTSVASPAFAGIMALVNQQTGSRQGNANYIFYKLAAKVAAGGCNSTNSSGASCIFNDVTKGTIATPCKKGSPDCNVAVSSHSTGVLKGYNTTTAYDLATGLGTVNAQNLVSQWNTVTLKGSVTTLTSVTPATVTHGQPVSVSLTVAAAPPATGTPSGTVALIGGPGGSQLGIDTHALSAGAATWSTSLLPGGTYNVTAHYPGDGTFGSSDSTPLSITVNKEASLTNLQFVTFNSSGFPNYSATSALYGSPYILRIDVTNAGGASCEPNPARTIACATGNLNLTDNGSVLDGGTFVLNSLGYTEDQIVQLTGGTHVLQAQYAGDSSFTASAGSRTVTITKATTSMSTLVTSNQATVGVPFFVNVTVLTNSNGASPSGTVSFTDNGAPLSGTVSYLPHDATASTPASLQATINGTISTPGTHSIVAIYNGDVNYATSTSGAVSVNLKYPSPTLNLAPTTQTINPGDTATLVATIHTTGAIGAVAPSGTVDFTDPLSGQAVTGTTTYATFNDGGGNPILQATFKFTPNVNVSVNSSYKGDSNYPAAQTFGTASVVVNGSDYNLSTSAPSLTVTRGAQGTIQIAVQGQSNYNATLNFAASMCSGLPAESSCAFSPLSVAGPGATTLTISTTAPHTVALNSNNGPIFWMAMSGLLSCVVLLGVPRSRKRIGIGMTVVTLCMAGALVGCGGGGGGGGGHTDPGTPVGSYAITVAADSTHRTNFTLVVQ